MGLTDIGGMPDKVITILYLVYEFNSICELIFIVDYVVWYPAPCGR